MVVNDSTVVTGTLEKLKMFGSKLEKACGSRKLKTSLGIKYKVAWGQVAGR